MTVQDGERELILDSREVTVRIAEQASEEGQGVRRTVLWEQGGSAAGVLDLDPGARIGEHVHEAHAHHVWVVAGRARVLDQVLADGSYWYVPPGRPHTLEALAPTGCRLFYLYVRSRSVGAQ